MRRLAPLAVFWALYMGGLGIYFPFYSLYLRENVGLPESQVGLVLAVVPLMGILCQSLWGYLADRSGSRRSVLAGASLGAGLGWTALAWPESFVGLVLATAAAAVFFTSVIPMAVSVSLGTLSSSGHGFGLVRMFGTLGFFAVVVGFPGLLGILPSSQVAAPGGPSAPGLGVMFPLAGGLAALASLVALTVPNAGSVSVRAPAGDWRRLLRHPPYLRALGMTFLTYLFLQGPIVQFPLLVLSQGGDLETVSRMWIPMLALEVPLVAASGLLLARIGPRGLLGVGMAAAAVRWVAAGLYPGLPVLFGTSLLHGVIVVGVIVGGPYYIDASVPERLRSTAQGLCAMVGVSAGSIVSNVVTGWLFEHVGPTAPYLVSGAGLALLTVALPFALPPAQRPEEADPHTAPIGAAACSESGAA